MSLQRLNIRNIGARDIGVFRLDRHDLRFHKISIDGSAKCDAYFTGSGEDFVLGVLYEISDRDKKSLDRYEGLGSGYTEKEVAVCSVDQTQMAITYIATNIEESLLPYSWYVRHVLEGAKAADFPDAYLNRIENVASQIDTNSKREQQELSIYG